MTPAGGNPLTGNNYYPSSSFTTGGVTFDGSGSPLFVFGADHIGEGYAPYDKPGEYDFDGTATFGIQDGVPITLTANLPADVTAVGTEIGGFEVAANTVVTVTLAGEAPQTEMITVPNSTSGLGFVGFVAPSGDDISSISFTDSTIDSGSIYGLDLDNFLYGITDAVPEPSALSLIGVGALALVIFRRKLAV